MRPERVGEYLIEAELGRGGMGTVYRGRHATSGQVAAVKVLPAELARQPSFVERFQREIELLKLLDHPNIVRLYEAGVSDGFHFYVMEFVDGQRLDHRIMADGRIDWQTTIDLILPVCRALKHAHDHGVIHRDLKPSNLLIASDGTIKLSDFGIAKAFDGINLTATGGIIGTAEYMSPEQAEGKVTVRSDLYSLGVVLYVMLTGRPPFVGKSAVDLIRQHRFSAFDTPRAMVPDLPVWVDELVCSLLEKDPQKRPASAQVLARRLESIKLKLEFRESGTRELAAESGTAVEGDDEGTTVLSHPTLGGKLHTGTATLMQRVLRWRLRNLPEADWSDGIRQKLVPMLILVVAIALVVLFIRSRFPESRWHAIVEQAATGDELTLTYQVDVIAEFIQQYPDNPHAAEARSLLQEQQRRLDRQRFLRSRTVSDLRPSGGEVSPLERQYRRALLLHWLEGAAASRAALQLIASATNATPQEQTIVELAREDLVALDMEAADQHLAAADAPAAIAIWRRIIAEHEKSPSLSRHVQRARRAIDSAASQPTRTGQ